MLKIILSLFLRNKSGKYGLIRYDNYVAYAIHRHIIMTQFDNKFRYTMFLHIHMVALLF